MKLDDLATEIGLTVLTLLLYYALKAVVLAGWAGLGLS